MPIVDMPLKELYEYQGLNERPGDIDAYWDRGIYEMERLGTGCELIPADFQVPGVECFEMYFTGIGGSRIARQLTVTAERYDRDFCLRVEEMDPAADAVVIFGGSKLSGVGKALGQSIREFKKEVGSKEEEATSAPAETKEESK